MNKRRMDIINDLANLERTSTLAVLTEKYGVSTRTIRSDLGAINEILEKGGLSPVELRRGGEIHCGLDFVGILELVDVEDYYEYRLSREERIRIAATLMVQSADYITLSAIAEHLFVSRATVIEDLDEIKNLIRRGGLEVISSPNKGQRVVGKESAKRLFLLDLQEPERAGAGKETAKVSTQAGNRIVIQKIINEQEHVHKSYLDDASFTKISSYLGIMIDRNLMGEYMEPQPLTDSPRYRLAQDILKYICQYCQITTTEDELRFLCGFLSKCRFVRQSGYNPNIVKIQMITRQFIRSISEELELDLNMDYDFFENLSNHLESVLKQEAPFYPDSAAIREIVEDNPGVHTAVKNHLPVLRQYYSRPLSEIEIQYITIHVCAALERKKNREIVFHVAVVCHSGIGTSQLLMEKLKKHFNFQVVEVLSAHEARNLTEETADFILSTIPLKNCKLDHVVVSPMFSDEDYIRVGNKIDTLRNSRNLPSRVEEKAVTARGLLKLLKPVIYEMAPDAASGLYREVRRVVRHYFDQSQEADEEIFAPCLHHLLPPDHIQLDVRCTDWRDAVRKSAEKLLNSGYIEARYIDAMIANIEENGPYVVLSPGFAMPHEGLEQGSIKVGMNLIRLNPPVDFGEEEFDPVEFVCCLSAVDHKLHLKAFFNLVNMLGNPDFKDALRKAGSPQEAAAVVERYEYTLGV